MSERKSVYQKVAEIQERLFVPKGNRNNYGNYNYRSCEDILKKVKPLCSEQKLMLGLNSEVNEVANQVVIEAEAYVICLETGNRVSSKASAIVGSKGGMDMAQASGAALSYARKYALAGLFAIDNEKDNDTEQYQDKVAGNAAAPGAPGQNQGAPARNQGAAGQNVAAGTVAVDKDLAIAEVMAQTTRAGVQTVYSKYPTLNNDKEFSNACNKKWGELKN